LLVRRAGQWALDQPLALDGVPTTPEDESWPLGPRGYPPTILPALVYQALHNRHDLDPHGPITQILQATTHLPSLFHPIYSLICNHSVHDFYSTAQPDVDYLEALHACLSSHPRSLTPTRLSLWLSFSRAADNVAHVRNNPILFLRRCTASLATMHAANRPPSPRTVAALIAYFRRAPVSHLEDMHLAIRHRAHDSVVRPLRALILNADAELPP
jgi:hypothetical protein